MPTSDDLTRTALVVGIIVLLIMGVNAGLGTVQTLTGRPVTSGGLTGILGGTGAGTLTVTGSSQGTNDHTLSIQGVGSVSLPPDEVQIMLGELTQASTAQAASEANAKVIAAVISQLNSIGVTNSSISTSSFYITPMYDYKAGNQTIVGYQAVHMLQITLQSSDLNSLGSKAGQVIDVSVGAGANQLTQLYFTLSDQLMKQTGNQALQLAIQDASSRAQLMAAALNIKLLGVDSVSTSAGPSPLRQYVSIPQASAGGIVSTGVLPGNFTVTASVQIVYDI